MRFAAERFTKNLWSERKAKQKPTLTTVVDEAAQARHVAKGILESREAGVPLSSQAVLFRASRDSAHLETELSSRNIPFVKHGGLKFLEAAHVKDVLGVLRWTENSADRVAAFRVLQLLPGIGSANAARIFDQISGRTLSTKRLFKIEVPKQAAQDWPTLACLLRRLRKGKSRWPAEFQQVRQWYEPHLRRMYDDADVRAADIGQLEGIAAGHRSRERFLTELTLDPPDATTGESKGHTPDEDCLVLSTIHSAKGQEWRIVRILSAVEGCIPSPMATSTPEEVEEERRLLHVAMTRAKDELDLVLPHRLFTFRQPQSNDQHLHGSVTRFVPRSIHSAFETRFWPDGKEAKIKSGTKELTVASNISRLWR